MPTPPSVPAPAAAPGRRHVRLAGLGLALLIITAYATSFRGVMVFDDFHAIVDNPLIRDLRRLDLVLFPPAGGGTVAGRPVINFTLALNHAVSGLAPWSYHLMNLAIHVAAALVLFGLVRRTLLRLPHLASDALPLALAISALWALHPLQTESVTYLIQRAESLCGLFLLLTLYCFVRALAPALIQSKAWLGLSAASCLLGMGTKEVMAAAPLLALLYDRTFLTGSWRETWRQRGGFHSGLMATWAGLAALVLFAENRGGTTGFGTAIGWWPYLVTQCHAIILYLRLALWPAPLVFDYGTPLFPLADVLPQALAVLALLGATVWALVRRPAWGFVGAWFFLILAPSSSFIPVATQTVAEHRMYLPLAAVMVAVVWALRVLVGQYRAFVVALGLALAGAGLTAARNCDYHSELALWADTAAHRPQNARARSNHGIALTEAGRFDEAVAEFKEALRLQPDTAAIHLNLCDALVRLGRAGDAIAHGEAAVRLGPGSASAHLNLANALEQVGRIREAATHYETVLKITPDASEVPFRLASACQTLGNQAASRGDFAAAINEYRRALSVVPDYIPARANLANALLVSGRVDEAITEYREVLRRQPDAAGVRENLTRALEIKQAARP